MAGGAFFLALLAPRVHGELPPFDNSPEVYSFDSYYTVARWLLLTVLLLLATNLFSMFYLRWAVGSDTEEARDSVPIVLCALSQSVAWGQALMLLLRMSGLLESDWGLWGASAGQLWSGSLQSIAAACLWQLTPFAYLYHAVAATSSVPRASSAARRRRRLACWPCCAASSSCSARCSPPPTACPRPTRRSTGSHTPGPIALRSRRRANPSPTQPQT